MSGQPPVHTIIRGKAKVSIWAHEGDRGTRYNFKVETWYRKEGGGYENTEFFSGADDARALASVALEAESWIEGKRQEVRDRRREESAA